MIFDVYPGGRPFCGNTQSEPQTCKNSAHSLSTVAFLRAISSSSAPVARMTRAVSASVASFFAASSVLRVPMPSLRTRRKCFLQSASALCTSRGSVRRRTPSRDTKSSSRPSSTARLQTRRCQVSQRGTERAYLSQIPCSSAAARIRGYGDPLLLHPAPSLDRRATRRTPPSPSPAVLSRPRGVSPCTHRIKTGYSRARANVLPAQVIGIFGQSVVVQVKFYLRLLQSSLLNCKSVFEPRDTNRIEHFEKGNGERTFEDSIDSPRRRRRCAVPGRMRVCPALQQVPVLLVHVDRFAVDRLPF